MKKRKGSLLYEAVYEEATNLGTGSTTDQATEIGSDVDPVD